MPDPPGRPSENDRAARRKVRGDRPVDSRHPRRPLRIVLDSIRSAWNVGAIFRTADAVAAEHIHLGGITATPPNPKLLKTALGTEASVPWSHHSKTSDAVQSLRAEGYTIICLERTAESRSLWTLRYPERVAIVIGHEILGVSEPVLALADEVVELPMEGRKSSLNVSTAFGVLAYEVLRQWSVEPS